ncbi:hypothetical protein BDV59DRAFT_157112 [Aspergillus ambiguus]|uniref:uncharacterized protein n=1 Tax=Aspergillus ambiguus TaxID=176160 RepID=UPI003CCD07E8
MTGLILWPRKKRGGPRHGHMVAPIAQDSGPNRPSRFLPPNQLIPISLGIPNHLTAYTKKINKLDKVLRIVVDPIAKLRIDPPRTTGSGIHIPPAQGARIKIVTGGNHSQGTLSSTCPGLVSPLPWLSLTQPTLQQSRCSPEPTPGFGPPVCTSPVAGGVNAYVGSTAGFSMDAWWNLMLSVYSAQLPDPQRVQEHRPVSL